MRCWTMRSRSLSGMREISADVEFDEAGLAAVALADAVPCGDVEDAGDVDADDVDDVDDVEDVVDVEVVDVGCVVLVAGELVSLVVAWGLVVDVSFDAPEDEVVLLS